MNDSRVDNQHIILATKGCPGIGCKDERNEGRIIYWSHSCGNTSYLDRNAKVICYNCNTNYLILDANFKCRYDSQYRECNYTRVGRMLSALACIESARTNISKFDGDALAAFLDDVSDSLFKKK